MNKLLDKKIESFVLTPTLLQALQSYAANHGRTWKSSLRQCWMTGQYGPSDASNHLQQIRNSFGPSWLVKFRLPAMTDKPKLLLQNIDTGQVFPVTPNPAPKTSDYTQDYLTKRHLETFRAIAGGYPEGQCVNTGWLIRVSNHGASLVTGYIVLNESGHVTNEHSEAL